MGHCHTGQTQRLVQSSMQANGLILDTELLLPQPQSTEPIGRLLEAGLLEVIILQFKKYFFRFLSLVREAWRLLPQCSFKKTYPSLAKG